jgi:hypothetical protein
MTKKYFLSFQTVFRLNENAKWLEEFLVYYINLGFDHFYLYDNDGSISEYDPSKQVNKNGDPVRLDEPEEDKAILRAIVKKYGDKITYTKWQPRDENNNIVYAQDWATMDFIKRYADETEWVATMDLDEFLYSENNIDIPQYLRDQPENVSRIFLGQKRFIHRFDSNEKYVTQDYRCNDVYIPAGTGGSKNIVRASDFIDIEKIQAIDLKNFDMSEIYKNREMQDLYSTMHLHLHDVAVKHEVVIPPEDVLRFNHYQAKVTEMQRGNEGHDDCMKRYANLFDNLDTTKEGFSMMNVNDNDNYMLYIGLFVFLLFAAAFMMICYNSKKNRLLYPIFFALLLLFGVIVYQSSLL